jgi:hypothetical protein
MAEKQKALKGRQLLAGKGPGRGPRSSPEPCIPESLGPEKVAWEAKLMASSRAPAGYLWAEEARLATRPRAVQALPPALSAPSSPD